MATAAIAANGSSAAAKGSNSAAMKQAWIDKCKELGERVGGGAAAQLQWFEDMVERSNRGDINPDDAADGFAAWREAVDAKAGPARAKTLTKATREKSISEAKTMITWGMLPDANAPRVFATTIRVINETASLRGEVDEKILKIARAQIKSPDSPLTAAEIKAKLLETLQRPDKVEVQVLDGIRKQLNKVGEKFSFSGHVRSAISSITARIDQLGGTTAENRAAAKAAKAAEKAAGKGKGKGKK